MAEFEQDPPQQREQVLSAHGGFINRNVPWLLGENQVQASQNLIINTIGARTRRGGARAFGGISGGVANAPGGFVGYNDENFAELIASVWGNELYSSVGNGGWAQVASGESLVAGLLHDLAFVDQGGALALAVASAEKTTNITEASTLFIYDVENDASTHVSGFGPRCIASFQNRLWAGIDQTLHWSNINEPAHMSLGNTILVEPGLGGQLTAIVPARDRSPRLWLFKDDAVLVFEPKWGSSSALIPSAGDALDVIGSNLRVLTQGAGCVATRSAVWVPGEEAADLFFLARDGVRSLRRAENDVQAGAGFPLSYDISGTIDRINWTAAHRAAAVVHDNAYHLALPLDGALENTHVLRFDIATRAWSLLDWRTKDVRALSLGGQTRFFFQSTLPAGDTSSTGADTSVSGPFQIYQGFLGDVDPSEAHITFGEDSRAFIFGQLATKKRWDRIRYQISSTETASYAIDYRVDFGPWTSLVSEALLPGDGSSVLLGGDPLAWTFGQDVIRTRDVPGVQDIQNGYQLQLRFTGVTDATDVGRISLYNLQVFAFVDEQLFEVEN